MSSVTGALRAAWSALAWVWDHSLGFLLAWALVILIRAYQVTISPLLPPTCRFHPSCSAYALGSIRTHGALKGFALGSWRLLRCNPWNGGGYDPVPERGHWLPDVHPNGEPRSGTMTSRSAADTNATNV